MLYLGIDQHAMYLTVSVRDERGSVVWRRQVSTRPDKLRAFFEHLQSLAGEGGFMVMLEICGFNDWLLELLPTWGCQEIIVVQPEQASRRKTDRRDADRLSELLWINRERLLAGERVQGVRRIEMPSPEDAADRQLTVLRKRLGGERTRTVNQIKHIIHKYNLIHEQPTRSFQTRKVQTWLTQLTLRAIDRLEVDQLLVKWRMLELQIKEVQTRIAERCRVNRRAQLIGSITGKPGYSALAIACRIGSIERFARGRSLANFWGLTPTCHSSGNSQQLGHISKEGSSVVRFLLGQLVLHALRRDAGLKRWYQQVKKRRGTKIARVGVMRKLATSIHAMIKRDEPYVPVLHRQPPGGLSPS
ncbi:MAG: IS110 family transposase [Gimesia chilikensis]